MPEPQNNSNDVKATDPREGIDRYRVSPELKFNRGIEPAVDGEIKSSRRDMPRFAEDDFYQFRTPGVAYENGGKDGFLPDGIRTDGSTPRHMMPEDNSGIDRKK